MKLRVMTWNIWAGRNWTKVAEFIKENKIDIVGFQEVDRKFDQRTNFNDVYQNILDNLGFNGVYGPCIEKEIHGEKAQYGNCIMSRFPIIDSKVHLLSPDVEWTGNFQTEPRCAVEATIMLSNVKISFITLHAGYERKFKESKVRDKQFRTIMSLIEERKMFILCGDFNAVPDSPYIKNISERLEQVNKEPTWPTVDWSYNGWEVPRGPTYQLDNIFVTPDITCKGWKTLDSDASDHAPVIAELEVN